MEDTVLTRIFAILQAHGVIGGDPAPVLPADAQVPAPTLAEAQAVFDMLNKWLPDRIVFYDTECIYEPDAYAELVRQHANATRGEWQPQQASSEFIAWGDPGSYGTQITFEHEGEPISWEFEQNSKWVHTEFWDALDAFSEEHLSGDFVSLPSSDQCVWFVYLPRAATDEIIPYLEMCGEVEEAAWAARRAGQNTP